jgi:hypothetical protein
MDVTGPGNGGGVAGARAAEARVPRGRSGTAVVLLAVVICGWVVMEMEILGARLLVPFFGSSNYVVMGSVIGVFLLSLALGYTVGAWVSSRRAAEKMLGVGLVAAGLWLCGVPFARAWVCDGLLDAGFDEKWGSLVASFALFGVPTCVLGTVSPIVVRQLTSRAERAGTNAGLVLAASTVAGFAGCVTTAFYLIRFSVKRTVGVSGAVLVLLGSVLVVHAFLKGGRPASATEVEASP